MDQNNTIIIAIAKDFTEYPGARYRTDGPFSGQEFYEDKLKPLIEQIWNDDQKNLLIDLDGTMGYASSFISEVFTRLVKEYPDKEKIRTKLQFKSEEEPLLIEAIQQAINTA